jgi:hypothetical protein
MGYPLLMWPRAWLNYAPIPKTNLKTLLSLLIKTGFVAIREVATAF